jgi:hypothetical protein
MSNEIFPAGQPSALTEEDHLSAMIVERDAEIVRLKGVIEHLRAAPLTDAQISKAARYLSDKCADECAVDKEDYWKIYGQEAIDELVAAIESALTAQVSGQPGGGNG